MVLCAFFASIFHSCALLFIAVTRCINAASYARVISFSPAIPTVILLAILTPVIFYARFSLDLSLVGATIGHPDVY